MSIKSPNIESPSVNSVFLKSLPSPISSHHSHATLAGSFVFVSGLVSQPDGDGYRPGVLTTEGVVTHDVTEQLQSIFQQLDLILVECQSRRELVVDVQIFMKNIKLDFGRMNESYREYFGLHMPSRTTVEVVRFPSDVVIELKVIALQGPSPRSLSSR